MGNVRITISLRLAIHHSPTVWMQNLTRHVRRIVGRQKYIAGGDFLRLASSIQRHVGPKCFDLFSRKGRRDEGSPHGARRDTIHANAFIC